MQWEVGSLVPTRFQARSSGPLLGISFDAYPEGPCTQVMGLQVPNAIILKGSAYLEPYHLGAVTLVGLFLF